MNFFSKLIITVLAILSIMFVKDKFFDNNTNTFDFFNKNKQTEEDVWEPEINKQTEVTPQKEEQTAEKQYVSVYFTTNTSSSLKK